MSPPLRASLLPTQQTVYNAARTTALYDLMAGPDGRVRRCVYCRAARRPNICLIRSGQRSSDGFAPKETGARGAVRCGGGGGEGGTAAVCPAHREEGAARLS